MINSRIRHWSSFALLCAAAFCTVAAAPWVAAQEMKPVAVIALSGYDSVIQDINFAGSLAGMPTLGDNYKPFIEGYVNGLDKSRPFGVIIQSDGADFSGAACVPVSDFATILNTLGIVGVQTEDAGDGVTKIEAPQQPVFVKEKDGWAFVAPTKEMLNQVPATPEQLITAVNKEYDLGARFHIRNIPEAYRQLAVGQLEMGMQMAMQKLPDETDEQFQARKEMANLQMEQLKEVLNSIDELTIGFSLDEGQQRAFLDFVYTATEGSKLAEQIAMQQGAKTDFAGFYQPDAAATMTVTSKVTESDIANVEQMFGALRTKIKNAIAEESELPTEKAKETVQSAADDFLDALQATVKSGVLDGGMVLNVAPTSLTFVAGGYVGEPDKIMSGLKKLEEVVKDEKEFPGIKWNAVSHGDVSFHTLAVPVPEHEDEVRQLFGETIDVAVGIGKKSVYFALGRECMDTAKAVIDASLADPKKDVPPMELTISLQQIMEMAAAFADADDKPQIEMIANSLAAGTAGRDHVRIVSQPIDRGVRIRIEAEEGVLRALGMAAMQAQMQAAGAGQGF